MVFEVGAFFQCILLALLAEFGDKTWVLTGICAVWCPWCGLRDRVGTLLRIECLLVLVGVGSALTVRTVLLTLGVDPFPWDGFSTVAASIILLITAIRATFDWRCAVRDYYEEREAALRHSEEGDPELKAIKNDSEGYGATGGTFSINYDRTCWEWTVLLALAFFFPLLLVVFAEAMDRSQGIVKSVDHKRADLAVGAPVGFFCASILAMLFGYATQRFCHDNRWLLLFVCVTLWILTLMSGRDALTRLVMGDLAKIASK